VKQEKIESGDDEAGVSVSADDLPAGDASGSEGGEAFGENDFRLLSGRWKIVKKQGIARDGVKARSASYSRKSGADGPATAQRPDLRCPLSSSRGRVALLWQASWWPRSPAVSSLSLTCARTTCLWAKAGNRTWSPSTLSPSPPRRSPHVPSPHRASGWPLALVRHGWLSSALVGPSSNHHHHHPSSLPLPPSSEAWSAACVGVAVRDVRAQAAGPLPRHELHRLLARCEHSG